jgi:hypothetical protein
MRIGRLLGCLLALCLFADFSFWAAVPSLAWTQKVVEVIALAIIAALALALARVPRTLPRTAALSAAAAEVGEPVRDDGDVVALPAAQELRLAG